MELQPFIRQENEWSVPTLRLPWVRVAGQGAADVHQSHRQYRAAWKMVSILYLDLAGFSLVLRVEAFRFT